MSWSHSEKHMEPGAGSPTEAPLPTRPHPARISGTALVGSVHLSNGVIGTDSAWRLLLTGLTFPLLMALAAGPAFALTYAAQLLSGRSLIAYWIAGSAEGGSPLEWALWRVFLNVAYLLSFLLVLRLSPLSGYHAAEHRVVNAIEQNTA